MLVPPKLQVAVDVGCRRHSVAIGLSNGELLEAFDIDHRPEGFADFFRRIERHHRRYPAAQPTVAMEGYNGHARPLDTLVGERGWPLLNVNNLKLKRFKEMFPAAAKSDKIDAQRMLDLMQLGEQMPQVENRDRPRFLPVIKRNSGKGRGSLELEGFFAQISALCSPVDLVGIWVNTQ